MTKLTMLKPRLGAPRPKLRALPKKAERFYQSPEWKRYRAAHRKWTIEHKGGLWCEDCGSTDRLILDHHHERKDGGADFPPFEEAGWKCGGCHNRKTASKKAERAVGKI